MPQCAWRKTFEGVGPERFKQLDKFVRHFRDATAAAIIPDGDGYLAALINFRFIANAVWSTEEVVAKISTD